MDMHFVVINQAGKRFTSNIITNIPTWHVATKCAAAYAQDAAKIHGPVEIETIERVDRN